VRLEGEMRVRVLQETLDILGDQETLADLRQSREDFEAGDVYGTDQVRAELKQHQRRRGNEDNGTDPEERF
jgi:hypothetical protein